MSETVLDHPELEPAATVIMMKKRSGEMEPCDEKKLIKWAQFGRDYVQGRKVDWIRIVRETLATVRDGMSTEELHMNLIRETLAGEDDAHNKMAGVLYAPLLHKKIHPDGLPTVYDLQKKLRQLGLMKRLEYTKAEYEQIEQIIDHRLDYGYAHFQLEQMVRKYAVQDRVRNIIYETPQYTFMRMAMAVFSKASKVGRIEHIREFYTLLNENVINAPTPNYIYLGTPLSGLISCCLIHSGDSIGSINTADVVAYRMTANGAGIGEFMGMRGLNDPVRNGALAHNGKLPYVAATGKLVRANMQAGRAGAAKIEVNIFDRESVQIAQMQNPRTPVARRNRDLHAAIQYHGFFLVKAALDEEVFTFSCQSAPDLFQAFYGKDRELFEELYAKYEANPNFRKDWVRARELLVACGRESYNVGTVYGFFADNVNYNTPFTEPVYCSNLCVAPETLLMTDKGEFPIQDLVDKQVRVWNGDRWSTTTVVKTGTDQELMKVTLSNGFSLTCTPYHKWYILDPSTRKEREVRTHELEESNRIISYTLPVHNNGSLQYREMRGLSVASVEKLDRRDDTYCVTEPHKHMATFNGILTGQCMEILQPTHPYRDLPDLFETDYIGDVIFTDMEGLPYTRAQKLRFEMKGDEEHRQLAFADIQPGMTIRTAGTDEGWITVKEVTFRERQPETSLCALGGIVVYNVRDDDHYDKAMYYTQRMIAYCIEYNQYPFPQIEFTAKNRRNAGIGVLGAATVLARKNLRYDSREGLEEIHRLAERHMYFAIKNSIDMGEEFGNAPWIHKTAWGKGWMPIDTYSKHVDSVCNPGLTYDWELQRARLIKNGGMYFSCLVSHMPTESSSKAAGSPNGWYPVRQLSMKKSDSTNIIEWTAPDSDTIAKNYQSAYDIDPFDMINVYAVIQKFTDQGISADIFLDRTVDLKLSAVKLIKRVNYMKKMGLKTHYYFNSKTSADLFGKSAAACGSGGCTL